MIWLSVLLALTCATPANLVPRAPDRHVDVSPVLKLVIFAKPETSRDLMQSAIAETAAIWKPAGVMIEPAPKTSAAAMHVTNRAQASYIPTDPLAVGVVIDDANPATTSGMPLGWIMFGPTGTPERSVHLSRGNAVRMLEAVAAYRERSSSERDVLVGRALGRALAHELGHYLLASKSHTQAGLMRAQRTAADFFSPSRAVFYLTPEQEALARMRLIEPTNALAN